MVDPIHENRGGSRELTPAGVEIRWGERFWKVPKSTVPRPQELAGARRPTRNVFATSCAAQLLSAAQSPELVDIGYRLVAFLRSQRAWPGLWRYWGRKSLVPYDLDDSSLGQIVLRLHGVVRRRIDWLLALNRLPDGKFLAWMMPGNIRTLPHLRLAVDPA